MAHIKKSKYVEKTEAKGALKMTDVEGTPLINSISKCTDVGVLEQIIKDNLNDINTQFGSNNCSPLHWALHSKELVKLLLKYGANINATDDLGMTPLLTALFVEEGLDVITELLENGADVKFRDPDGNTVMHFAYSPDVVHTLVRYGADINAKDDGDITPLVQSLMEHDDIEISNIILSYGADPNLRIKEQGNATAIFFAKTLQHVKMLTFYGADVAVETIDKTITVFRFALNYTDLVKRIGPTAEASLKEFEMLKMLIKYSFLNKGARFFDYFYLVMALTNTKSVSIGCLSNVVDFMENLKDEYAAAKKLKLIQSTTLYDFLNCNIYNIRISVENPVINNLIYVDGGDHLIQKEFPILYDIFSMNKTIQKKRQNLLKNLIKLSIASVFNESSDCSKKNNATLNYDCTRCIADYLSYRELVNLFLASMKFYKIPKRPDIEVN